MESRELLSTFVVSNTSDAANPSPNSLRWAILQVDADTSVDTIDFDIPGSGRSFDQSDFRLARDHEFGGDRRDEPTGL